MPRSLTFDTAVTGAAILGAAALVATAALAWMRSRQGSEHLDRISALEAALQREKEARAVERTGRIALQQASRKELVEQQRAQGFTLRAIAHVESPFPDRRGTPRQPSLVPAATAVIVFDRAVVQHAHFAELALFSHLWIIFVFHDNTNLDAPSTHTASSAASSSGSQTRTATAKIRPPRLHGQKVGCLSTRSPHRPNPIGLSVCEIVSVSEGSITVRGIDLIHMTPVLDVKPYIPYDLVPSALPLPMAVYPHTHLYTHMYTHGGEGEILSESGSGSGSSVVAAEAAGTADGREGNEEVNEEVDGRDGSGTSAGPGSATLRVPAWIYEADVPVQPVGAVRVCVCVNIYIYECVCVYSIYRYIFMCACAYVKGVDKLYTISLPLSLSLSPFLSLPFPLPLPLPLPLHLFLPSFFPCVICLCLMSPRGVNRFVSLRKPSGS